MNTRDTERFLKRVLEKIYVAIDPVDLKATELSLTHLKTPKGLTEMKACLESELKNDGQLKTSAMRMLRDLEDPSYVQQMENELDSKRSEYRGQRQSYRNFVARHKDAIAYLTKLAAGCKKQMQPPEEELVLETLKRLNGVYFSGELGVGPESVDASLFLKEFVGNAAYRHAINIGKDPKEYLSALAPRNGERFITL